MEINSMTSMNDHEALISSDSQTTNDSPEESSWTFYMQDFICGNEKDDHESSISSSSPSPVSDAASSAARKLATDHNYETAAFTSDRSNCKKLSSRRGKAKGAALIDDLEDTASSPVNSPKVSCMNQLNLELQNHERDIDTNVSQGNISKHKGLMGINGVEGDNGYSELKKKGLCLVPLSMLANYFD